MTVRESFGFGRHPNEYHATWEFEESKKGFSIRPMADGFGLTLNTNIEVSAPRPGPLGQGTSHVLAPPRAICLSNLRIEIKSESSTGGVFLGTAFDREIHHFLQPGSRTPIYQEWQGRIGALERFERERNGSDVNYFLECRGSVELIEDLSVTVNQKTTRNIAVRTMPEAIQIQLRVNFPKEAWVAAMRGAGLSQALCVEIPLGAAHAAEWIAVWQTVDEARRHFEAGGTTGWNACVVAIRKALDAWQAIEGEKVDKKPGMPSRQDLEAQSKRERLDDLRWQLRQCANLAPHSRHEEWTREDAAFMLASLSGLLAIRKP